ncbi:pseudouridine synthase [Pseudochelatococcus contaminans]|uniref:Pseudouridine synthase n=1 Tax=Pseudochelatococcus contaminans TaxID=1538103 RepID=A0A7W6EGH3_9HYPH|nr:pseudouridine synthase [Pseudochelatococcus contaminans]MBB3809479.1 23S rRNA pseudouridine2605 synthase [Pseudochelatococcus contaminans]
MTDKSKNERGPARRPGGDAAGPSKGRISRGGPAKGAPKFGAPKFGGPRPFAGGKDGDARSSGRKFGERKFSERSSGEGRSDGGKSFAGKSFGGKSFGSKSFGGKSFSEKSFGSKPAGDRSFDRKKEGGKPFSDRQFSGKSSSGKFGDERPARAGRPRDARDAEAGVRQDAGAISRSNAPERIAKAMSRAGIASRRDAEVMIAEGRVAVNGKVIDTPVTLVSPQDRIVIDGAPMPSRDRTRLWLYHKPRGLVTTARDPERRPTVFDALPEELPRVVAVGRLDINTEGLLLLTNDGGLSGVLEHPETGWLRRYRVRAYGDTDQAQLDALRDGITIDGMHYGPVEALIQRRQGDNIWLTLGLREGKNREVKRILEHLGLRVNRLIRISFGPFQLGDLHEGEVEEVRTRVLRDQLGETLAAEAGADFDAGSFEPNAAVRSQRAGGENPPARREEAFEERSRQRAVWRDDQTEGERPRGKRIPRRGADAQVARQHSGERVHARVGVVTDPGGRKVKVERIVNPPRLAERTVRPERDEQDRGGFAPRGERPARRFSDGPQQQRQSFGDRPRRFSDRSEGFSDRSDDRRPRRPEGGADGERRFERRGERPAGGRGFGDRSRPEGDRSFGGKRFADRSEGFSGRGDDRRPRRPEGGADGERRFEKRGERPAGGRGFGDRSRPEGDRSFGGKRFADRSEGFSGRGDDRRPRRPEGGAEGERRFEKRGERPAGGRGFGDRSRPEGDRSFGGKRFADRSEGFSGRGDDRRPRRPEGGADGERRFEKRGERPTGGRGFGDRSRPEGGRSFAGKSEGRPSGGRPFGGKPSGDRPSGGRPSSDRPRGGSRPPRKS